MDTILQRLKDVEFVAEQILSDKQMIVNYDKQRQKNREAFNYLKRKDEKEKVWISYGNMFIKTKIEKAKETITEDQKNIDSNIDSLRDDLKSKMNELRVLENKPELKGYNLKSLNKNELASLKEIIPEVSNF